MLDHTLALLAQRDREREIADLHRSRATREALTRCSTETFVPPSPDTRPARLVRRASTVRGSV